MMMLMSGEVVIDLVNERSSACTADSIFSRRWQCNVARGCLCLPPTFQRQGRATTNLLSASAILHAEWTIPNVV